MRLVVSTGELDLMFLDVATGARKQFEKALTNELAFSGDGVRIAANHTSNELVIWNSIPPKYIDLVHANSRLSGNLALSKDGRTIAASGGPNVVHLWDTGSGRELGGLTEAHDGPVCAATVSHDGARLMTVSDDRTLRVWSLATGRQLQVLNQPEKPSTILLSRDGRSVITAMQYKPRVYLWDLTGAGSPAELDAPGSIIALGIAENDHDQSILALSEDGKLREWSGADRRIKSEHSLKSLLEPIVIRSDIMETFNAATFFADGRKLAAVAGSSGLHIVEVQTGKESGRIQDAELVASSPDKRTLAITRNRAETKFKRFGNEVIGRSVQTSGSIVLVDGDTCRELHGSMSPAPRSGPSTSPPTAKPWPPPAAGKPARSTFTKSPPARNSARSRPPQSAPPP